MRGLALAALLASGCYDFDRLLLPRVIVDGSAPDLTAPGAPDLGAGDAALADLGAQVIFTRQIVPLPGGAPHALVLGDFDNQTGIDIAVVNHQANTVVVLRNDGLGGMVATAASAASPVGGDPFGAAALDANLDGKLDLVVANNAAPQYCVLLGNGDGSFGAPACAAAGQGPSAVAAADWNDDGITDIAVADRFSSQVSICLGLGTGAFGPSNQFLADTGPSAIAVGRFNSLLGNHLDLALADFGAGLSVLLGDGTGKFVGGSIAVGVQPNAVVTGSLNRSVDALPDLAVADAGSNDVRLLFGDGKGSFPRVTILPVGKVPSALVVGLFNADGYEDLAVANSGDGTVAVFIGDGKGEFPVRYDLAVGTEPYALATADFDGDQRADLAVAGRADNTVTVLLNRTR